MLTERKAELLQLSEALREIEASNAIRDWDETEQRRDLLYAARCIEELVREVETLEGRAAP